MKKTLLLIIAAMLALPSFAQDGVKWEHGTLQEAFNLAKSNKKGPKVVFVDCFTTWCGPCKYMANVIFPTKEAGDYFNKNFVNIKIDMEKGEGVDIKNKYGVSAYPTFLILDQEGKEIGRVIGGDELKVFIERVEKAKNPENAPEAILSKYRETKDINIAYKYLQEMQDMYMYDKIIDFFAEFYDGLNVRDKYSEKTWTYISSAISLRKPFVFDKLMNDKFMYDRMLGKAVVDGDLTNALRSELIVYLSGRSKVENKYIENACEIMKIISNGKSVSIDEFIVKASVAKMNNDTETLLKMFDGNAVGYGYSAGDIGLITRIALNSDLLPEYGKARFLKEYIGYLQKELDYNNKTWEKYKDVEIPERDKKEGFPAFRIM